MEANFCRDFFSDFFGIKNRFWHSQEGLRMRLHHHRTCHGPVQVQT